MPSPRAAQLLVAFAVLALVPAAAGAVRAAPDAAGAQPQLTVPSKVWRAEIQRVLHGLRPTTLAQLRVGAPPTAQQGRSVWLYADLLPGRAGDSRLRGEWEADLVAGALRDRAAARGLPPVAGVTIWEPPSSTGSCCSRVERRLTGLAPATALAYATAAPDVARLRRQLEPLGVRLDSLTVRRPLGLALEARVTTGSAATPADVLRARSLIDSPRYDGLLFEARDTAGDLVFSAATTTRVPASASSPFCYLPCNPSHLPPSRSIPIPLSVESLLVCGSGDTRPLNDRSSKPFYVCTADRADAPISGARPVYCSAIVVGGRGHVLTMQIVRDGAVVRAGAFAITSMDAWYQTLTIASPPSGPFECRVLVDGKPAMTRSFEIL